MSPEFNHPVTSIQRFVGVGLDNIFLITVNKKEVFIYSEDRRDSKPVPFSTEEKELAKFVDMNICNTQVAFNSKFFVVGLVSEEKSVLGVFEFNRENWSAKPIKWITKVSKLKNQLDVVSIFKLLRG